MPKFVLSDLNLDSLTSVEAITGTMQELQRSFSDRIATQEELDAFANLEERLNLVRGTEQVRSRVEWLNQPDGNAPTQAANPSGQVIGDGSIDSEEYTRAFREYLITGMPNGDLEQRRSQTAGIGTSGGYTIPTTMQNKIIEKMEMFGGGIYRDAFKIRTTTSEKIAWQTVDDRSANAPDEQRAVVVNEGGIFTGGTDISFGRDQLDSYIYAAGGPNQEGIRVSRVLLQDSQIDIEDIVSEKLVERIMRLMAYHWVRGNGVSEPEGIIRNFTTANLPAGDYTNGHGAYELLDDTAGIQFDDLINIEHSIDPAYRDTGRAAYYMHDKSVKAVKKMKNAAGDNLWRNSNSTMASGTQGTELTDYPINVDQGFSVLDVDSDTTIWGVFGDIYKGFAIREINNVAVEANPYSFQKNLEIEYFAWAQADSVIQDPNAYVAIVGEAA